MDELSIIVHIIAFPAGSRQLASLVVELYTGIVNRIINNILSDKLPKLFRASRYTTDIVYHRLKLGRNDTIIYSLFNWPSMR